MSFSDYNEFIQREFVPDRIDTVVYRSLDPFIRHFGTRDVPSGDRITSRYRLAHTSNAAFYDKSDVDPAVSTQTLAKPYWTKVFAHGATEVHGIDIANSKPDSDVQDMIADALDIEVRKLIDVNVAAMYTQWKADIDSSGTAYSDASLSRSTYPLLVSYEEVTDAAITLAYQRAMQKGVTLNKSVNLSDYICVMEGTVYHVLQPLAAALHTWNVNDARSQQEIDMGWQPMASFEGLKITAPDEFPNMTTGDVFMLRKQDVNICVHMPLEVETVPSGRHSIKMVPRIGINTYVDNPYLNGKMLNKD